MFLSRARLGLIFFALVAKVFAAQTWYVAGNGDDAHDGKTLSTAFRSLHHVSDLVEPGDTVLIGNGNFGDAEQHQDSSVVTLHRSGRPDAWITWKAAPGTKPELHPRGWNGILVTASYQVIDGLTVLGPNDSITLSDALADGKKEQPSSPFNTNGIYVNGRLNAPDSKPHHVIIRNCVVGKNSCGGIIAIEADYVTIEDCVVFENAWYARYGASGISTLTNWRFDDAPGYHVVIQRNLVWSNRTMVPWEKVGRLSDGNGIILDVTDNEVAGAANPNADAAAKTTPTPTAVPTPPKPPRPEWRGRTLVANNISAYNGGSGIHTFRNKHADIINNTTYWNGQTVGYAEIFANRSEDIIILNNIMVPRPRGLVTTNNRNTDVRWDYNLYPVAQETLKGPHDIVGDPHFVLIRPDLREANFRLSPGSPGLDSGTNDVPQATDLTGQRRPQGSGRDRGAYEQ